jgi:hypothetical protein
VLHLTVHQQQADQYDAVFQIAVTVVLMDVLTKTVVHLAVEHGLAVSVAHANKTK